MLGWVIAIGAGAGLAYLLTQKRYDVHQIPAVPVEGVDIRGHGRKTREGYLLTGRFDVDHVPRIRQLGTRMILSQVELDPVTLLALSRAGIDVVPIYTRSTWRHGAAVRAAAQEYDPGETMIHCEHGVDRTGNVLAHLLVTQHGWPISDAFYSAVYAHPDHVARLGEILADYNINDRRSPQNPSVGFNSLGRRGGMKTVGEGYERLIRGNIEDILAQGAR